MNLRCRAYEPRVFDRLEELKYNLLPHNFWHLTIASQSR